MPFVEIFGPAQRPAAHTRQLADAVQRALVAAIGIPAEDRFQAISSGAGSELIYDPGYLGIQRSPDFTLVRITLRRGRTVEQKRALYREIAEEVRDATGIRPEDVLVVLVENELPDWSFGKGVAQYTPGP
jgi:phenylpyruvate tautomerase PptA (4-oxalocrotonate tautomerase family)